MTPPIRVYLHVARVRRWREIAAEILAAVEASGLAAAAASLTACVVDGDAPATPGETSRGLFWPRWRVERVGRLDDYEYPTLARLRRDAAAQPEARYLYLHTKGAANERPEQTPWRRVMLRRLVAEWRGAIDALAEADAVGCRYIAGRTPRRKPHDCYAHFRGNWWMAAGSWLAGLPEPAPDPEIPYARANAEFWLLRRPGARVVDLCRPAHWGEIYWSGEGPCRRRYTS